MDPFPPSRAEAVRVGARARRSARREVLPAGIAAPSAAGRRQVLLRPPRQRDRDAAARPLVGEPHARRRRGRSKRSSRCSGTATSRPATNKVRDYRMMLQQNQMLRANASGEPARSAGRDPARIRRCSSISTTARTSRATRTRTSAASCSSCSRWASATTRERDVREAARAFTGWTNDVLTFKFDARAARLRREDVPRPDRTVQRRRHHRHHPRAAGDGRVRGRRSSIATSCGRTISPAVKAELGRAFRASGYQIKPLLRRMLLSKDFYSAAVGRDSDQEPGASRRLDLQEDGPARGADDSGLRSHDRRPGPVAVRSAERRRAGPAAARGSRQPRCCSAATCSATCCSPTSKASVRPIARCPATDARVGERLAQGHEHHRGHPRKSDAESNMMVDRDEDYNTRYGGYARQPARVQTHEADSAAAGVDRSDGDGHGGACGHRRQGRRSFRPPVPERAARGQRIARCSWTSCATSSDRQRSPERDAGIVAARAAVSGAEHAGVSARLVVGEVGRDELTQRCHDMRVCCVFSTRLSRPRAVRHRPRRGAAADPEPHVRRARRAGAARHEHREASGPHPRRHRAVGRQ